MIFKIVQNRPTVPTQEAKAPNARRPTTEWSKISLLKTRKMDQAPLMIMYIVYR